MPRQADASTTRVQHLHRGQFASGDLLAPDLVGVLDTLAETASGRWDEEDPAFEETLQRCVRLLDLGDAVVVSRGEDDRPEVVVSSSGDAAVVGMLEAYTGQGPCTDALSTGERVLTQGDRFERSWPRIAPELHHRGYHSVAAVPFGHEQSVVGLFAARALNEIDCAVARTLLETASARATLVRELRSASLLVAQLQEALDSRIAVEQAKGVIAERYQVPVGFAFRLLRNHARSQHVRLHALAVDVVNGRTEVPGPATPSGPPPPA